MYYPIFINGEFIETDKVQEIINPASQEVIATVAVAGEKEINYALESARSAFDHGEWPKISLKERASYILKISQGILESAGELAKLETQNNGKPIKEATFMDIPSAAQAFKYFSENLEKYLRNETLQLPQANAEAMLLREPLGVAVLIIPWNYPLLIAAWKMSQALAAGNTVILKPSSLTPLTALELAKIIHRADLPKGAVNVIQGSGAKIGEMLCADKRVDMVSFTGSNEVGRQILQYAAKNVKKLVMELGGKSASIILKDADLELAVNGSLCSIFLNQGQMCTAMSRLFIEGGIYDKFVESFVSKAKSITLGNGLDYETQMGPLISAEQRNKVMHFVEAAKKQGAKLLCGGKIPGDPHLQNGFFFEPTIFGEVKPAMDIFKEEVFGPVVCLNKFSEIEEAIKLANTSDFALAACIWTKNISLAQELSGKINAGTCWINTYGMFYNELPYGGFKKSGFGKELGREGFLEYTRLKNIIIDRTKDAKPLVNYWYGV